MRALEIEPDRAVLELSRDELVAINNVLGTAMGGPSAYVIPEWEFHALIGIGAPEAQKLLEDIGAVLDSKSN